MQSGKDTISSTIGPVAVDSSPGGCYHTGMVGLYLEYETTRRLIAAMRLLCN
jgi:hypothetical protein